MKKLLLAFLCLFTAAAAGPLRGETLLSITSDRKINFFDSASPGTYFKTVDIQGLAGADIMLSASCSPINELFVLTHAGPSMGVRTVNPQTGAILDNLSTTVSYPASATAFGMDVDTTYIGSADVVSDADQIRKLIVFGSNSPVSLSYDPADVHAGADPAIVAVAHTNNFVGAKSSVIYGIDSTQDTLVKIERVTGRLNTIGALGVNTTSQVGFDISGVTGNAYAVFSTFFGSLLYTINLSTGAGTLIGPLPAPNPAGVQILAITTLPPTRVANLSTRGRVGTGDDVMIAGFIAPGGGDKRKLLVRGIGPSLGNSGVQSPLADPVLKIVDGNGVEIATNNDWRETQENQIFATGLAPTNDLEAAYFGQFAAGVYTAILSGNGGGTGVGLIEVYQFDY